MKQLLFNRITIIMLILFSVSFFSSHISHAQLITVYDMDFVASEGWTTNTSTGTSSSVNYSQNGAVMGGGSGITVDVSQVRNGNTGEIGLAGSNRWFDTPLIAFTNDAGGTTAGTLSVTWFNNGGGRTFRYYIVNAQGQTIAASGAIQGTSTAGTNGQNTTYVFTLPPITGSQVLKISTSGNSSLLAVTVQTYSSGPNLTPVINPQTFSTSECSIIGTSVGTVAASDPNPGQTLTYSITAGNTGNVFAINSSTGEITVAGALDFETTTTYPLTVQVTDDGTPSDNASATITVDITDCTNENNPAIAPQTFSINENSAALTAVGTVVATDADAGQTLSYSITAGNTGNAFGINSSTGAIIVAVGAVIDYETTPVYSLTVEVTDNGSPIRSSTATITVNVNDIDENPNAPVITPGQVFSVAENSANGTVVGTVLASDADAGQTLTYMILSGNTGNAFAINSSTGEITVAGPIDFETLTSYSLLIRVFDNGTPSKLANGTVTINVTDVFDPNLNSPVIASGQVFSVTENSANGTAVGTVSATDADAGQLLSYSIIGGNTGSVFAIDVNTGAITVAGPIDFETTTSYTLTVQVCDNGGPVNCTSTPTIEVDVTDVAVEGPPGAFTQRKTWDGTFAIRMTSSANLQNVWLNQAQAVAGGTSSGFLLADSVISNATMQRTGSLFDMNNRYKNGASNSIFENHDIPKSAFLCGDPEVGGCLAGLLTQNTSSSCPVKRYNGPDLASTYVAMTYSDYDNDLTTYSSSMGALSIPSCAVIETAYLYWVGTYSGGNPPITLVPGPLNTYDETLGGTPYNAVFNVPATPGVGGFDVMKFKVPGGTYQNVTATTTYTDNTRYVCVADVTSMIQGSTGGNFWAANIKSYPFDEAVGGGGSCSGWTLIIVYNSPLNPPTKIALWDGLTSIDQSSSEVFNLTGFTAPSSGAFSSYIGLAALDAEDIAPELVAGGDTPSSLGFDGGNGAVSINPFQTDQPPYKIYNKKGYPAKSDYSDDIDGCKMPLYDGAWASSYDGVLSSQITSYSALNDKNGNQITRLPSLKNTLGYDAHHIKLPAGAVAFGATSATLTVSGTNNGSTSPFMAYVAIESVQPNLVMTKTANVDSVALGGQITYTLKIVNEGNSASLGNDKVYDSLDVATDYVAGSLTSTAYVNGVASAGGVTLVSSANDSLEYNLVNPILGNDSVIISFQVNVKPLAGNTNLWNVQCKRSILNTSYVEFNTGTSTLVAKSNSNPCGVGSQTIVQVSDPSLASPQIALGPFDGCSLKGDNIIDTVKAALANAGVSMSNLNYFKIKNADLSLVAASDVFDTIMGIKTYKATPDLAPLGVCLDMYTIDFECGTAPPPIPDIYIPNLITPGNDSHNNTFEIVGLLPNSSLQVFNRWGKQVYSSDNYANEWKPDNNASGIYFFYFSDSVRKKEWKGWIQVINDK